MRYSTANMAGPAGLARHESGDDSPHSKALRADFRRRWAARSALGCGAVAALWIGLFVSQSVADEGLDAGRSLGTAAMSTDGNGVFGHWFLDERGGPAYEYTMDQLADPRAEYRTSAGPSRDHWHLVGNDRVIATAHNGGYVQLYDWSRGGKVLDRWDPARGHYGGGFKFVTVDGDSFCTRWDALPADGEQRRIFGAGHFEKRTRHRGVEIVERIEAPPGDDAVLISFTQVRNETDTAIDIGVTEFWDSNLEQLTAAPVLNYGLDRYYGWRRQRLNGKFDVRGAWDAPNQTLRLDFATRRPARAPKEEAPATADFHLRSYFLAALDPLPAGFSDYATTAASISANEFDLAQEDALIAPTRLRDASACLAIRRTARLAPWESITFRYAVGYGSPDEAARLQARYAQDAPVADRARLRFEAPGAPWLTRELAWHSYYLQAGSVYSDFFKAHVVDQGSAYAYLQGLSGAPRDFALFTLPMVYLRPDLAKDMLRFLLRAQDASTGALPYAIVGHGETRGYVVHGRSSDLDLFVLWALAEYLGATRDLDFLGERIEYYPRNRHIDGTVRDHARAAFRHLRDRVGLGPHGLVRCGTGDWNDVLLGFSRFSPMTLWRGESSLNAGLATVALPALAGAIEEVDAPFASELRAYADAQAKALEPLWTGEWLARGYLGYGDARLGHDRLFLDTQAFPVIGGVWPRDRADALFKTIQRTCVGPQRAGGRCLWPPMRGPLLEPGSDTNGGTWAAIDAWTAWAWSGVDARAAWDFFLGTTMHARANAYPDIWYGIWSGPDSYNADEHPRAGETFDFNATPMARYPVMNMNRHTGPLLDAIKFAGIGHRNGRIVIGPRVPFDTFSIDTPLIAVAYAPGEMHGRYTPVAAGTFRFSIAPPRPRDGQESYSLVVNGSPVGKFRPTDPAIEYESTAQPGAAIVWRLE